MPYYTLSLKSPDAVKRHGFERREINVPNTLNLSLQWILFSTFCHLDKSTLNIKLLSIKIPFIRKKQNKILLIYCNSEYRTAESVLSHVFYVIIINSFTNYKVVF